MLEIQNAASEIVEAIETLKASKSTAETLSDSYATASPSTTNTGEVWGTVLEVKDKQAYVLLDGDTKANWIPLLSSAVGIEVGFRCRIETSNHLAYVKDYVSNEVNFTEIKDNIENNTYLITLSSAKIETLESTKANVEDLTATKADVEELKAFNADIDNLIADKASVSDLEATNAKIDDLSANTVTVDKLEAVDAKVSGKADINLANINEAAIEKLATSFADIELANISAATIGTLFASDAAMTTLKAVFVDSETLKAEYATIDFANIGEAALKKIFAESGIISDLVVENGTVVTGELVGVTIKGDIIEGGTIIADKLVIKGDDGLFYKLNTNGETVEANQTAENSLSGSVITAKSITAEKVSVSDLVAFGATIGGIEIEDGSIHSVAHDSATATTPGFYISNAGEFSVGDSNSYIRHTIQDGKSKIEIQADTVRIGSSSVATAADIDAATSGISDTYATKSELNATSESITSTVASTYATKDDLSTTESSLSSQITQSADSVTLQFNSSVSSLQSQIDSVDTAIDDLATQTDTTVDALKSSIADAATTAASATNSVADRVAALEPSVADNASLASDVRSCIAFGTDSDGSPYMDLSTSGSTMSTRVTNSRMSFMSSGAEVAYVSGEQFAMVNATVDNSLQMGNFVWQITSAGGLRLAYNA
jgi:hypothetical protein